MLKEKLVEYYGDIPKVQDELINKKCLGYTLDDEEKLFEYITENCPRNFGFPDVSKLSTAFKEILPSNTPRKYSCCVCSQCGTYYHTTMMFCPECWKKGERVMQRSILIQDDDIPNVIHYNQGYGTSTEEMPSCYNCIRDKKTYCKNFGRPNFFCEEMRECECNSCCVKHKKKNEEFLRNKRANAGNKTTSTQ